MNIETAHAPWGAGRAPLLTYERERASLGRGQFSVGIRQFGQYLDHSNRTSLGFLNDNNSDMTEHRDFLLFFVMSLSAIYPCTGISWL